MTLGGSAPKSPPSDIIDLRTDLLEREGQRVVEKRWKLLRYEGLDIGNLDAEQKAAYQQLGKILDDNEIVAVEQLNIVAPQNQLVVGNSMQLRAEVLPAKSKRHGVVWESNNPNVLSVDKFGIATALEQGQATVSVYSWDDAEPLSANRDPTYFKTGITDNLVVTIVK